MSVEIFNHETTYKTSYHGLQNVILPHHQQLIQYADDLGQSKFKKRAERPIDNETYDRLKKRVPFGLLHRLKPIVMTDPATKIVKPIIPNPKEKCRERRKTRKRVYMVPQVCVDDIPEDTMYDKGGFVDSVYTSEWAKAVEITNLSVNPVPEVYTNIKQKADPMRYIPMNPVLPIRLEQKAYIEEWEKKQKRYNYLKPQNLCVRNKMEAKKKAEAAAPKNLNYSKLVTDEEVMELKKLLEEDCLRQAFDRQVFGFAGHVSEFPVRMHPRAKRFTKIDELLTTYQIDTGRYQPI